MRYAQMPIEFTLYAGKSTASLREFRFSSGSFRLVESTGRVEYDRFITGHFEHGADLPADAESMFHVARDFMAGIYMVIESERRSDPKVQFYFDHYGKKVKLVELSQLFLMDVCWPQRN